MLYCLLYLYDSPGALRMHRNDSSIEISMGILKDQKANRRLNMLRTRFRKSQSENSSFHLKEKPLSHWIRSILIADTIFPILRVAIVDPSPVAGMWLIET